MGRPKKDDGFKNPQERYDAANCKHFTLKLNYKTDSDILTALEGKPPQTEIKRLVRLGLAAESQK